MRMNSLDGIVPFVAVAEARSFTAAAARLRVTRSAVSQAIKALERRVGVPLFARTTRDVGLTAAGATLYAEARAAVAALATAEAAVSAGAGRPAGMLRITAPRLAAAALLAPRLADFLATYPEITLELSCDDALRNIVEDGFDAGVRLGESVHRDMVAVRLSPPDRLIVVGAPDYFAVHGYPAHPRELTRHRCINFRESVHGGLYRWEFDVEGEALSVGVDGPLIVGDTDLKLRAALAGVGLACDLESLVAPYLASGALVATLTAHAPSTPGFFLYFPHRAQVSPALRSFVDFFRPMR